MLLMPPAAGKKAAQRCEIGSREIRFKTLRIQFELLLRFLFSLHFSVKLVSSIGRRSSRGFNANLLQPTERLSMADVCSGFEVAYRPRLGTHRKAAGEQASLNGFFQIFWRPSFCQLGRPESRNDFFFASRPATRIEGLAGYSVLLSIVSRSTSIGPDRIGDHRLPPIFSYFHPRCFFFVAPAGVRPGAGTPKSGSWSFSGALLCWAAERRFFGVTPGKILPRRKPAMYTPDSTDEELRRPPFAKSPKTVSSLVFVF